MKHRTVFFISDRTGITAETLGNTLTSQFDDIKFDPVTLSFVDDQEKAEKAIQKINTVADTQGIIPIVFSTIIDPAIRNQVQKSKGFMIDFIDSFIGPLEDLLGTKSNHTVGRSHGVVDLREYYTRIESVNFALQYDDGASTKGYQSADVILVGVSRCGKTPTALYLAMHYGIKAANYPLTEEDLESGKLPKTLDPYLEKLFGITIEPMRLQQIRSKRRPSSEYAMLQQCQKEVKAVERLYRQYNIPFISSTSSSIEEMSARILSDRNLKRRLK